MELTKEQSELLAKFTMEVLEDWPDMGSLDGGDLQDIAVKHNILIPHIVHGPCCDDCFCSEFYGNDEWQEGVTCYRIADWLDRQPEQRNEADSGQGGASPTEDDTVTVGRVLDDRHAWL